MVLLSSRTARSTDCATAKAGLGEYGMDQVDLL